MGNNGRTKKPPRSLADLAHQPKKSLAELVHGQSGTSKPEKPNPELSSGDIFQFITGLNVYLITHCQQERLSDKTVAGPWELLFNSVGLCAMKKADGKFLLHSGPYTVEDLKMDLSPYYLADNWLYDYDAAKRVVPDLEPMLQEEITRRIEALRTRLSLEQKGTSTPERQGASR